MLSNSSPLTRTHFVGLDPSAKGLHKSMRRRIMAVLRMSSMTIAFGRTRAVGALGVGAFAALSFGAVTPVYAQTVTTGNVVCETDSGTTGSPTATYTCSVTDGQKSYGVFMGVPRNAAGTGPDTAALQGMINSRLGQGAILIGGDTVVNGAPRVVSATGTNAISLGNGAQSDSWATAIGPNATAKGNGGSAIAIGANASATGGTSVTAIAIGESSIANHGGVAMGYGAEATQNAAVAIGWGAKTNGAASGVAIGDRANATGQNAIAIGGNADQTATVANGAGAVALGSGANATGRAALALGGLGGTDGGSIATDDFAVAIGAAADATGKGAVAIGGSDTAAAVAAGTDSFAMGAGAKTAAGTTGSASIGFNASAAGNHSFAMGTNASATVDGGMALGRNTLVTQANGIALGDGSQATTAAVGTSNATVNGITYGTFAGTAPIGVASIGSAGNERQLTHVAAGQVNAGSTDAINGSQLFATTEVIENVATSTAQALGGGATVGTDGTISAPTYTTSTGTYNNVGAALGAANTQTNTLGSSVASGLGGNSTYNPVTGQMTTALTVGGTNYTDVNSALNAVNTAANAGFNITDAAGNDANIGPSGKVAFVSGNNNLTVEQNGADDDGNVEITMADDIALNSVTTGNTVMNNNGVTVSGGPNGPVSLTNGGLNNGGNVIAGVAAGALSATSTEAVNGSQLYAVSQVANAGWNVTVAATGSGQANGATVANVAPGGTHTLTAGDNIVTTQNGTDVAFAVNPNLNVTSVTTGNTVMDTNGVTIAGGANGPVSLTGNGLDNGGNIIIGVAEGALNATSTEAVNGSQLYATNLAVEDATLQAQGNTTALGGGAAYDPVTNTYTAPTYTTSTGTYNNVGDALGAANDQTNTLGNSVASGMGGNSTYDPTTGQVTTALNVGGTNYTNVNDALNDVNTAANAGWNVTDAAGSSANIGPNGKVAFVSGNTNLTVEQNGADDDGNVEITMADDIALNSVTTGNTVMNNNGVTVSGGPNGPVSLTNGGLNNGGNVIAGVAAGALSATSTEAVNGSQLYAVSQVANAGWNVTVAATGSGQANGATVANVAPGGTHTLTAGDNIVTTQNGTDVAFAVNPNLNVTSVTTGNTVMDTNGVTIAGGANGPVSLTGNGLDNGGNIIIGVAEGALNATSTEAVNGSQLYATNLAVEDATLQAQGNTTALGGGAAYDPVTNTYTAPTYTTSTGTYDNVGDALGAANTQTNNLGSSVAAGMGGNSTYDPATGQVTTSLNVGGNSYSNVNDALGAVNDAANAGWNVTDAAGNTANIGPNGNVAFVSGNSNLTVTQNGADDDGNVEITLADDLDLNSVTTGNTVMDNNGVTVSGGPNGPVSLTGNGLNNGGNVLAGVADGAISATSTDAINGSQLYAVSQAANAGWNVTAGSVGTGQVIGSSVANVGPGGTHTITAGNNMIATQNGTEIQLAVNPNLQVTSVTTGNTVMDTNGVTVSGGANGPVSLTGNGLDNGGNTITNVAAGVNGTDAVNVDQLVALGNSVASSLGAGSSYNPATGAINTQIAVGGTIYTSVESAIQAVGSMAGGGFQMTTNATGSGVATNSSLATVAPGSTVGYTAGNNIMINQNGTNVEFAVNPNLTGIESIAVNGGPTINGNGIDMGGDRISNVGAGINPGDAVNLGQMNAGLAGTLASANAYTDAAVSGLRFDLDGVRRDANGGTASAMAMSQIPQAFEPGMGIMGMGVSVWQGQQAVAMGFSKASDDGRLVVRASGTYNSRGQAGGAVGFGVQF